MSTKDALDVGAEDWYGSEDNERENNGKSRSVKNRLRTPFADACQIFEQELAAVRAAGYVIRVSRAELGMATEFLMTDISELVSKLWRSGRALFAVCGACGVFVVSVVLATRAALSLIFLRR